MWLKSRYYYSVYYKSIYHLDSQIKHVEDLKFHAPSLAEEEIHSHTLKELRAAREIKSSYIGKIRHG